MNYIPTNTTELYDRLKLRGGLAGGLALKDDMIFWQLTPTCVLTAFLEGGRAFAEVRYGRGRHAYQWRPDPEDLADLLIELARVDNMLVFRTNLFTGAEALVYKGPKANCPVKPGRKWSWGKLYIVEPR